MSMRDYEDMKDIVIPKEQEEMMNIICDAWEECRTLKNCEECPDRPKKYMRMMMCTSLKYTRKLIEDWYTKRLTSDVREVKHGKMNTYKPRNMNRNATYKCSVCGKLCSSYYNDVGEWKFCPNCGANMDLEDNE